MSKLIDLAIIKKMVVALEVSLDQAEKLNASDKIESLLEFNRAAGLASGVMDESMLIIGDIRSLCHGGQPSSSKESMEKILSSMLNKDPYKN